MNRAIDAIVVLAMTFGLVTAVVAALRGSYPTALLIVLGIAAWTLAERQSRVAYRAGYFAGAEAMLLEAERLGVVVLATEREAGDE